MDELRRSGLGFRVVRADARVQGRRAPVGGVGPAGGRGPGVDVVLLVRGGGATTDLAAFDSEVIARAVAGLDTPVLTGIGHDIDRSVADEVAHAAYKTPTACAQAVVADVLAFEGRLGAAWAAWRRTRRGAGGRVRPPAGLRAARGRRHPGRAGRRRAVAGGGRRPGAAVERAARCARSSVALERTVGRVESSSRAHLRAHEAAVAVASARLVARAAAVASPPATSTASPARCGCSTRPARWPGAGRSPATPRAPSSARRAPSPPATCCRRRWPRARCRAW